MSGFPVDSLKEAAPLLRRPFTVGAVRWKPQSQTKTGKTLCVAYIDARLVIERLNLVIPDAWSDHYRPVTADTMWCDLTVAGITRSDVGEGKGKALVSDALKRAAVRFGVGVSLYAVPQMYLDGTPKYLSDTQQAHLRGRYKSWLDSLGIQAFGEPLDHGDHEDGSQGDVEAEMPSAVPSAPPEGAGQVDAVDYLIAAIRGKDAKALKPADVAMLNKRALANEDEYRKVAKKLADQYEQMGGDVDAVREQLRSLKAVA